MRVLPTGGTLPIPPPPPRYHLHREDMFQSCEVQAVSPAKARVTVSFLGLESKGCMEQVLSMETSAAITSSLAENIPNLSPTLESQSPWKDGL